MKRNPPDSVIMPTSPTAIHCACQWGREKERKFGRLGDVGVSLFLGDKVCQILYAERNRSAWYFHSRGCESTVNHQAPSFIPSRCLSKFSAIWYAIRNRPNTTWFMQKHCIMLEWIQISSLTPLNLTTTRTLTLEVTTALRNEAFNMTMSILAVARKVISIYYIGTSSGTTVIRYFVMIINILVGGKCNPLS